ncbi:hypothetical protein E4K67_21530 [Desulfosporosinus fructosivorans]|uniref:Uncharacterized protein n=1 Tax=Desulfosporosinus fructosivorans TaxID=2018669 RepID=A0A4Z0R0B5_9FIRM|nr:hypothetical protein [Desulfosporosinus fructosivorans]TGE36114.1 hypothetical protein E4K67_21530 [Desulfosporosinus fructosivorans]
MRKLRIILVWTLVSLFLQGGAYTYLDNKVHAVMTPIASKPITLELNATIPGSNLENIQISYAKDYLAYTQNGTLKIFNLVNGKQVFEKKSPSTTDKTLGVLTYQWLPDRSTLLYFYAKKNPNEVTTVTIYPKANVQTPPKNTTPEKTEDPNQKIDPDVPKVIQPQPYTEKRYGNPQLTELYTLELPDSDDNTPPEDRFNQTIDQIPKGGKIENLAFSTSSNLIYLTVKTGSSQQIMEIDVMKNVRTLNKSGEVISNMAASDRYGTLYVDSKIGNTQQIIALNSTKRWVISKKSTDRIIGVRDGKVYIGEVLNNELVKIKTTSDRSELTDNPSLKTEWEGKIPFKDVRMLIGSEGQVIVYDHQIAYVIKDAKITEIKLDELENYISIDGAELIQLDKQETSTGVKLQPLMSKE